MHSEVGAGRDMGAFERRGRGNGNGPIPVNDTVALKRDLVATGTRVCESLSESLRESTRVCESLRESAGVYESQREFTRVCESLRESARVTRVYESLRESARVCESLRESAARVCESLRESARVYESLREFARVCERVYESLEFTRVYFTGKRTVIIRNRSGLRGRVLYGRQLQRRIQVLFAGRKESHIGLQCHDGRSKRKTI